MPCFMLVYRDDPEEMLLFNDKSKEKSQVVERYENDWFASLYLRLRATTGLAPYFSRTGGIVKGWSVAQAVDKYPKNV